MKRASQKLFMITFFMFQSYTEAISSSPYKQNEIERLYEDADVFRDALVRVVDCLLVEL